MKVFKDIVARRRPMSQDPEGEVPVAKPVTPPASIPTPAPPDEDSELKDYSGPDPDLERARLARDAVPQHDTPKYEPPKCQQFPDWERPTTRLVTHEEVGLPPAEAEVPQRKKIWDMEPADDISGDAVDAPEPAPAAPAPAPAAAAPAVPAPAARGPQSAFTPSARVKTRLLGFHSEELAKRDVFADKPAPAPGASTRYPIGWVVVMDGPGRGHSFTLTPGLSTIGRGMDQTVALDFGDGSISRDNHASIAFDEEDSKVLIGHGGKSNIVRLNGKPLLSTEALSDGDEIRIGKTMLRYVALCGPDFNWTSPDSEGEAADE